MEFFTVWKMMIYCILIQLTMGVEGNVKHYVNLLSTPPCDDCKRITCPVYTIRPPSSSVVYRKYIVDADQFAETDFETLGDSETFSQCAKLAADADAKMMFYEDGLCNSSNKLYYRREEPCDTEKAYQVYMIEPLTSRCNIDGIYMAEHGDIQTISPFPGQFRCDNGEVILETLADSNGQSFPIFTGDKVWLTSPGEGTIDDGEVMCSEGYTFCLSSTYLSVYDMRPDVKKFANEPGIEPLVIHLQADPSVTTKPMEFLWYLGIYFQPQGTTPVDDWVATYVPTTYDNTDKHYGYMSGDGIFNDVKKSAKICCFKFFPYEWLNGGCVQNRFLECI